LNSRLNSSDAALKLMEAGKVYLVVRNLKKFERLNQKVAQKLIKAGYIETVLNSLERFEGLNHKMAFILTKAHGGLLNVLRGMKQFDERYHSDIALMLIKAGHE
jgi:hypothetical protein